MASKPTRTARLAAVAKASRTRSISSAVIASGAGQSGPNGIADGAMVCQGSAPGASGPAAFPRALRRGLAAGMRELDADLGGAEAMAMGDHARERGFAVIGIEPEAAVADAAAALDVGHLGDHQAGAGIRQHAEMVDMPVGGDAVVGAVLAHGRDDDPVRELEVGEPDRGEQSTGHVTRG